MEIAVQKEISGSRETWLVKTGSMAISFSDQGSAMSFADKLKERVEAPHPLLGEVLLSSYAGLGEVAQ
ncbi:hypothetical protein [Pseudomonas turukhanskensis]|uniref:Uncharacterized protein n=1 Tax=Pseudomonas turukhanskensis TaxID=1806536 RepID=A0A9W6K694_9PSED|nr:hypothetical protein [Pseudomonas turukhanskensis]GLK88986.1 hypothetical protein GCM10017655_20480 [Pseudomonas turukhanskensis]